jgi:transketolase
VLGAIPGMLMAEPCCSAEVAPLLDSLLDDYGGSGYLRLVSIPCDIPYALPRDYRAVQGEGVELRPGKDGVIIGYGPVLLPQAWDAADLLQGRDGLDFGIVNLPWLNRVDPEWLRKTIGRRRAVFTLDNHLVAGGQGRMIAAAVATLGLEVPPLVQCFGLTDFPQCGRNDEVLRAHRLDAESLAQRMHEVLEAISVRV